MRYGHLWGFFPMKDIQTPQFWPGFLFFESSWKIHRKLGTKITITRKIKNGEEIWFFFRFCRFRIINLNFSTFELNWRWLLADFRMISQYLTVFSLKLYNQTQTRRQDIHWEKGWEMLCVLNKAANAGAHWRQPRFTSTVLTAFCEHFDAPVAQCTKIENSI